MKQEDAVVVVTGASDRLGRQIALSLAQEGYAIVVHCHTDTAGADETAALITASGGQAHRFSCDLTTSEGIESLVRTTLEHYGRWDGLVNAASIFSSVPIEDLTIRDYMKDQQIHQRAPFFLSRALYLHAKNLSMPYGAACVVNITDTGIRHPVPSRPSYYVAKSALEQQTIILGRALAPYVRVNAVAPGAVLPATPEDADYFTRLKQDILLRRLPSVQNVVSAVLFLFFNDSITGQTIVVDGGEHLQ